MRIYALPLLLLAAASLACCAARPVPPTSTALSLTPIISVLIAGAIAFAAWLIQRALHRAEEQRRVAARLQAYLIYWQRRAIELKAAGLLRMGEQWYEEDRKAMLAGGSRADIARRLVEIENRFQSELGKEVRSAMEGKNAAPGFADELRGALAKAHSARDEVMVHLHRLRGELIDGKTYVPDSDLAILDVSTVGRAVELRLTMAGLLADLAWLFQSVEVLDDEQLQQWMRDQATSALLAGLRVAYGFKYLTNRCQFYLVRSRLRAIEANLLA